MCEQDYEKRQLNVYPPFILAQRCLHIMICEHELSKQHLEYAHTLTCLMAVTVMTKNRGSPLVIGEVGVSIINCKGERASG